MPHNILWYFGGFFGGQTGCPRNTLLRILHFNACLQLRRLHVVGYFARLMCFLCFFVIPKYGFSIYNPPNSGLDSATPGQKQQLRSNDLIASRIPPALGCVCAWAGRWCDIVNFVQHHDIILCLRWLGCPSLDHEVDNSMGFPWFLLFGKQQSIPPFSMHTTLLLLRLPSSAAEFPTGNRKEGSTGQH